MMCSFAVKREREKENDGKEDKPEDSRTRQKKRISSYLIGADFRKKNRKAEKREDIFRKEMTQSKS